MMRRYLEQAAAFDPGEIATMSKAFEEACNALHVFHGDARGREIIATRIVDLARGGVVGADALRDRVLLEAKTAA
jgi:hypothetical protein